MELESNPISGTAADPADAAAAAALVALPLPAVAAVGQIIISRRAVYCCLPRSEDLCDTFVDCA
jgi:hypothetical protein